MPMTENELKILSTICQAFPKMTDADKERFLTFSEGMAFMAGQMHDRREREKDQKKGA